MRMNFDELFTIEAGQVIRPKVQVNIMSAFWGGPEMSLLNNTINGVDPLTWQGKDLLVELRQTGATTEYYIRGLAPGQA